MAIALVQSTAKVTHNGGGGQFDASFGSLPTSGNLLVAYATTSPEVVAPIASQFTDNKGNTWQIAASVAPVGGFPVAIAYLENVPAAGGTFTCTYTPITGAYGVFLVQEWSGLALASALDKANTATGSSTAPSVASGTTTQADELVVALSANASGDNPATYTRDAAFTESVKETDGGGIGACEGSYRIVSGIASYTSTWATGNYDWAAAIATFKMAAAATLRTRMLLGMGR